MCEVTFTGSLYYCLRYKGLQVLRCSPLPVAIRRPKFTLPSRHFYDQENFRTRTGVQPRFTFLYQFHAYCIVHIALSLLHAFGVVTQNRPFSFPIDPIMGVKRSFETLIEDCREDARLRVAQTNVVSRHLRRIFTATKAFKHSVLADHDLETLGIKLFELDLQGACSDVQQSFYHPLPKAELPEINWDNVHFSKWHEGRAEESLRVCLTLQSVSGRVFAAWFRDRKPQPWVHRQ